jgi:putative redox protein
MSGDTLRTVSMERAELGRYEVRNVRGGKLSIGEGKDSDFTPVELLLVALGGCTAIDVDYITSKRAEPVSFSITVNGDKLRDAEKGNHLENLEVQVSVTFPAGEKGDAAREALPMAMQRSHDRLCTVGRTVETGTPIRTTLQ